MFVLSFREIIIILERMILGQSLDNKGLTWKVAGSIKAHSKQFIGHQVSGYACQVSCSSDGAYVVSGDGDGQVFFWDWKTQKMIKKMSIHKKAVLGCIWHPQEPKQVATASWDGAIKLLG